MVYEYTLHVDGVQRKVCRHKFRPNLVTAMIEDVLIVDRELESIELKVRKVK